ncbi:MAG TPA: glycosyltransferase family 39 protein [Burkholderiales bacterium]|nr:glycosyltransferase family 39 protein [Burkholderiales bacterium]
MNFLSRIEPDRRWLYMLMILAVSFSGIFDHDLWTPDEPRAAELSREFLDHGRWSVPTLNQEPFVEKPPLVYWVGAMSLKVLGTYDWAVRIAGLLFSLGTLFFVYLLAKRLVDRETAWASVLVLLSTVGFLLRSHHFETDVGLVFFVTGAAYFLYRAVTGTAWWYIPAYLFALGAFFSKGFIGFAFLGLLFLCWTIWLKRPREIMRARPWIGVPLLSAPIMLWFSVLAQDPRGDLLHVFLYQNHLQRLLGSSPGYAGGHTQPLAYYLLQFPIQCFPWALVLAFGPRWFWSQRAEAASKFLLAWFVPGFILLTVAATKRGIYLLPLLPPLAIWVAMWFTRHGKEKWLAASVAVFAFVFVSASLSVIPRVNEEKSLRLFFEQLASRTGPQIKLYAYRPDETTSAAIPFYTGRYFTPVEQEHDLAAIAKQPGAAVVVVVEKRGPPVLPTVRRYFPHEWIARKGQGRRGMWVLSNVSDH